MKDSLPAPDAADATARVRVPKSYDELIGATGRAIYFRPERARVRDFLSPHAQPRLRLAGHELPVFDLSMNGISFLVPQASVRWKVGEEVEIELLMHGRVPYAGRARVARVDPSGRKARIGLALTRGFIDLPALARQDEEERLQRELSLGPLPYEGLLPDAYLQALQRTVVFVQYYRKALQRHEARYKAVGGTEGRQAIEDLQDRAVASLSAPWRELRLAASAAAVEVLGDPVKLHAAKELTETVLTPLLLEAPCVRRSYEKPLGYPGDYQVMLYCYNHAMEGDTVFGRVFHKLWLEHPLPSGVRTRRDLVVELALQQHDRVLAQAGDDAPDFRVTSLGCGPAREVPAFVSRRSRWPGTVHWTLIDQDEEALSVAWKTAHPPISQADGDSLLRCLNLSFTQLVQEPNLLPLADGQHLIASSGLFDYLRASAAQELLAVLYERLAPGGLIAVGNAIGPNEDFWSPGLVLDWNLLYRTRADMEALAARLPDDAQAQVTTEPGGAYYYLLVRKPEAPS